MIEPLLLFNECKKTQIRHLKEYKYDINDYLQTIFTRVNNCNQLNLHEIVRNFTIYAVYLSSRTSELTKCEMHRREWLAIGLWDHKIITKCVTLQAFSINGMIKNTQKNYFHLKSSPSYTIDFVYRIYFNSDGRCSMSITKCL